MTEITYRKFVFGFLTLFLLTLTNSIFLNQLGYYGALIFMLVRFAQTKESPFGKTGLEIPFLLFLTAELISAVLSDYQGNAFNNLLKRALLIPLVYVFGYYPANRKDIKNILKIYIFGSAVVCGIYVYNAVQHYMENLYRSSESGPSIFQYPITSAELYSFLVIILFALLRYGKLSLRNKIGTGLLLIVAGGALFATFKGTGWIGTAAGLFVILVYKRDWAILIPLMIFSLSVFIFDKNVSSLEQLTYADGKITTHVKAGMEGRLYGLARTGSEILLADFDQGVRRLRPNFESKLLITTPAPVTGIYMTDSATMVLELMDTRYLVAEKSGEVITIRKTLLSPGLTQASAFNEDFAALVDKDSGLTVYMLKGKNTNSIYSDKSLNDMNRIIFYSGNLFLHSEKRGLWQLNFINGIPGEISVADSALRDITLFGIKGNELIISTKRGTGSYTTDDSTGELILQKDFAEVKNAIFYSGDSLRSVFVTKGNNLIVFSGNKSMPDIDTSFGYMPASVLSAGDNIYISEVKRSKVLRLFDPYHYSNYSRIQMWITGWRIFKQNPFFGVGDISLEPYYIKNKNPELKEIQGHLHNNYVHVLAILGGFGFTVFIAMLIVVFRRLHIIYKTVKDDGLFGAIAVGIIGSYAGFLASGLTEWNFGDHEIITMIWFLTGLAIAIQRIHTQKT